MRCSNCGTDNPADAKFCGGCRNGLAHACPACGKANDPGMRFCTECGSALDAEVRSSQDPAPAADASRAAPVAERRLVSVLFADLVGFTTISEKRDAEEVRELLSRYFDTSRRLIELYGGTVEKFIGDAVMAVWGRRPPPRTTPNARFEPRSTSWPPSPRLVTRSARPSCEPAQVC